MVLGLAQTHNRWLVTFSCAAMAALAVTAGACRLFAEARQVEYRIDVLPGPPMAYASLGVIVVVFVAGMMGNLGLLLWPLGRRQGALSAAVAGAALAVLLLTAGAYAALALRLLGPGMTVSGGD